MSFRWHLFLANLDPVVGSEQGKTRPVIVVSDEQINELLSTVTVIPVTSRKPGRRLYPNEALIPAAQAGLRVESIALCHQIRTLDKKRLIKDLGSLDEPTLRAEIIEAVSFQLGLK